MSGHDEAVYVVAWLPLDGDSKFLRLVFHCVAEDVNLRLVML